MSSKTTILESIRKNKPGQRNLPDLSVFSHSVERENLLKDFIGIATGNMSNVVSIIEEDISVETYLKEFIAKNFPTAQNVYDTTKEDLSEIKDFNKDSVDLFIAEAKIGVAENACLWLDDQILNERVAAFVAEHSLLLINHKNIVPSMHQAYKEIAINQSGYGVFIAGPSKTADIEQSLVVGAQGPVSNTVIIF